jgi:hypothetical protein
MINGAHSIIYSTNPEADRALLRDVFKLPNIDVGEGWLIFGLPPAEVAVHPSNKNDLHELYFMCEDVEAFVAALEAHDVACGPVQNQGWGLLTHVVLPGGGKLGVYQPRHARPKPMGAKAAGSASARGGKKRGRAASRQKVGGAKSRRKAPPAASRRKTAKRRTRR